MANPDQNLLLFLYKLYDITNRHLISVFKPHLEEMSESDESEFTSIN